MTSKPARFWLPVLAAALPLFAGASTAAQAADSGLNLTLPDQTQWLAANATTNVTSNSSAADGSDSALEFRKDNDSFRESWLTGSKAHQYLGLGALALVAVAGISPKEEDGIHEYSATAATALAAAAVTTGFVYHWEDFDFSDGFSDPDNLHMLLAGLGTLAMMVAVSEAPETAHAGPGVIGGIAMATAIKITW